jgi:hypothetical protein
MGGGKSVGNHARRKREEKKKVMETGNKNRAEAKT